MCYGLQRTGLLHKQPHADIPQVGPHADTPRSVCFVLVLVFETGFHALAFLRHVGEMMENF